MPRPTPTRPPSRASLGRMTFPGLSGRTFLNCSLLNSVRSSFRTRPFGVLASSLSGNRTTPTPSLTPPFVWPYLPPSLVCLGRSPASCLSPIPTHELPRSAPCCASPCHQRPIRSPLAGFCYPPLLTLLATTYASASNNPSRPLPSISSV